MPGPLSTVCCLLCAAFCLLPSACGLLSILHSPFFSRIRSSGPAMGGISCAHTPRSIICRRNIFIKPSLRERVRQAFVPMSRTLRSASVPLCLGGYNPLGRRISTTKTPRH